MDAITIVGLLILGWALGATINYLADVLPVTRRLTERTCPACQRPSSALDYILMRPCPQCNTRRNTRAWLVQIAVTGLTVAQWYHPSPRLGFWVGTLLLLYFGVVAVIDIENHLILHPTSIFGAILGASIGFWLHGLFPTLLGGVAGFGIMFGLYLLGWILAKGMAKLSGKAIEEDALGFGDIILCGVLGLLLGWPGIGLGVIFTILIAGAGSLLIIIWQLLHRRYHAFTAVAFGPYLLLAACLLLYIPK